MAVLTADSLSLSLSVVTVASVPPAAINIPWNEPLSWPVSLLMFNIVTVFSPLMRVSATFFLNERSLLHCLFHAVTSVVSRMSFNLNKSRNFTPGFIMVLHTFGRNLKWNPHIHCLISEGGYSDDDFWRNIYHFNYNYLRNSFRTALLNEMELKIGPSFKKSKPSVTLNMNMGFMSMQNPINVILQP